MIFVKPLPPDYRPGRETDCTTSVAAPVADTLLAASNVAGVLYIAGTTGDKATPAQNALVTTALVWTIVYITSAIHGNRATATCREAVEPGGRRTQRPFLPRQPVPAGEPAEPRAPSETPTPSQKVDSDEPDRPPNPKPLRRPIP